MKKIICKQTAFFLLCMVSLPVWAQTNKPSPQLRPNGESTKSKKPIAKRRVDQKKGLWTVQWGYNRSYYTQSDIHFRGPGYNFTLHDVTAKDKPESKVSGAYYNPSKMAIPQYNFRFAYFFSDRFGIFFGQDHMKYVMTRGQSSTITGYIDPLAIQVAHLRPSIKSLPYLYLFPDNYKVQEGYHNGEVFKITPDFLEYDHTDGLNYFFVDIGFAQPLWVSDSGDYALSLVSTIGAGPVVCRSDVRLFGEGKNNNFHLSGYGVAISSGLRLDLTQTMFFEAGAKGGYIDLTDVYTTGRSKDGARQNFGFLEVIFSIGTTLN